MIKEPEIAIRGLLECQMTLQKQLDAKDAIIRTKDQQIKVLKEDIRQLVAANERMEKICVKQQDLLDEFSKIVG